MHLNCLQNCCCYSNFCNCPSLSIPTSTCYPSDCCCCPICQRRSKLKPRMPVKPTAPNGAAAATKNSSKSKNKTVRSKKVTRTSKQVNQNDKQENVLGLHSSSTSLKASESACRFNCFRTQSEKSDLKQKQNSNNSLPETPEDKASVLSDSSSRNYLRRSNGSNQSTRRDSVLENGISRPHHTFDRSPLGNKMQMQARSVRDQPARKCNCCMKPLSMYSSSLNASRHSFLADKHRLQLDAIDEVDSDGENSRRRCAFTDNYAELNSFWDTTAATESVRRPNKSLGKRQEPPPTGQAHKSNRQKSLEDSCADFLSIVCDNIVECVRKSVDSKLQEFIVQATDKFTYLAQELQDNQAVMANMFQTQAEKMNEQNKHDFEDFSLRLQNLFEITSKSNQTTVSETCDKECQFSGPEVEPEGCLITAEQLLHNGQEASSNISKEASHNDIPDDSSNQGNLFKCPSCDCCFEEEHSCHPCGHETIGNEVPINPNHQARESGGGCCLIELENRKVSKKIEELKPDNLYATTAEKICPSANSTKKMSVCCNTSGKTNCFCDSSLHSSHWLGSKMKKLKGAGQKTTDLKLNVHDHYDNSGYATEPEDNSELFINNKWRKRWQKKSVRQHSLNRQISAANDFSDIHATLASEASESSSTQTLKKQSTGSLNSLRCSPTRLSRL